MFGIRRSVAVCSTGWWVGPSSPRPMESWVKTKIDALLHQRRHAQRVARVLGEHQEGAAVGDEAAVQGDAVHDRRHAELAHTIVDVVAVATRCCSRAFEPFQIGEVGAGQVGRAAEQFRQHRAEPFSAFCEALREAMVSALASTALMNSPRLARPVRRQFALHAPLEFGGEVRDGPRGRRRNLSFHSLLGRGALGLARPSRRKSPAGSRTARTSSRGSRAWP